MKNLVETHEIGSPGLKRADGSTITADRIKPSYIHLTPVSKVVLADPRYPQHNRPARDATVKYFFGMQPEDMWPDEGMPSIFIDTPGGKVQAFVISKEVAKAEGRFQRCLCICPNCSETVPLGRLNQHWKVHL